jgi:hypothetical protein
VWQSGIKYQKAAIDESELFGYAVLAVFPRARKSGISFLLREI